MKTIKTGIIIILLIIIAVLVETRPSRRKFNTGDIHIKYDTTKIAVEVKTPPKPSEPILKYITLHDTAQIDSAVVVKAYRGKYHYSQVLKNDSAAFIKISQVISQGRPIAQKLTFIPRTPLVIIKPYYPHAIRILAGIILSGNQNTFNPYASIGVLTRKDNFYFAGYDPINKSVSLGFLFKIRLKSRKKQ